MDRSNIPVDFSMSNDEILKCENYLKGKDKFLEWGAGGSTLYFSSMVNKLVSIENDKGWYDKLQPHLSDNIDLHYVHQHEERLDDDLDKDAGIVLHGDYRWNINHGVNELVYKDDVVYWVTRGRIDWHCYIEYIKKPLDLPYKDYDVILVDGRARAMCAYVAKDLLKDGGHLLFHDFNNRPYYHGILKWYDLVDKEGSLAVLTKK